MPTRTKPTGGGLNDSKKKSDPAREKEAEDFLKKQAGVPLDEFSPYWGGSMTDQARQTGYNGTMGNYNALNPPIEPTSQPNWGGWGSVYNAPSTNPAPASSSARMASSYNPLAQPPTPNALGGPSANPNANPMAKPPQWSPPGPRGFRRRIPGMYPNPNPNTNPNQNPIPQPREPLSGLGGGGGGLY